MERAKSCVICYILLSANNAPYRYTVCNPQLLHFSGQNQGHFFTWILALLSAQYICANRPCEDELSLVISPELDTCERPGWWKQNGCSLDVLGSSHVTVCMYVCTYVRLYVCMYVRLYVCTYVRLYVCMYVCTFVCMGTGPFPGIKRPERGVDPTPL
jgi:hypothetical protein